MAEAWGFDFAPSFFRTQGIMHLIKYYSLNVDIFPVKKYFNKRNIMISKKLISNLAVFSTIGLILVACGGDNNNTPETITSNKYIGAGSVWDVSLESNNTFSINYRANPTSTSPDNTTEGNYTILPSGFLELEVNATTASTVSVGDKAYALEVPGYSLMLKRFGSNDVIPMITSGVCPSTTFTANYISIKEDDNTSDPSQDFFGMITYNPNSATSNFVVNSGYALMNNFNSTNPNHTLDGTCTNGIMSLPTAEIYLSVAGGAIAHTADGEVIFATPVDNNVTIASIVGTYSGIVYSNKTDETFPVKLVCDTAGVCTGSEIDITTDQNTTATVSINFTAANVPAPGFITGTINDGSGINNLACSVDLDAHNSGKNVMSCVREKNDFLSNILLVER